METFYLDENQEEVVFELLADGSVEKVWPYMAITDLNQDDLNEWLQDDIEKGLNSKKVLVTGSQNESSIN